MAKPPVIPVPKQVVKANSSTDFFGLAKKDDGEEKVIAPAELIPSARHNSEY